MKFSGTKGLVRTGLLVGMCWFVTPIVAEEPLLPIDEADRDLNFLDFRNKLQQVVRSKSPEELVKVLHPQLINGVNKPVGAGPFAQMWRIDAIDSKIWQELDEILSLGGGFVRSNKGAKFCAPYVFTNFPEDYDLKTHGAITGEKVFLMSEAGFSSSRLQELSYDIVRVTNWRPVADKDGDSASTWLSVATLDGKQGYVLDETVRSPMDYHACFLLGKKTGWKLYSFTRSELP